LEHKYAAVIGRLVKLWMAYKREKRRLYIQGRHDPRYGYAPPVEPLSPPPPQAATRMEGRKNVH
jgi:hypothetical protein